MAKLVKTQPKKTSYLTADDIFLSQVKKRFKISRIQAELLIYQSWRKFLLILAKEPKLRDKLQEFWETEFFLK